MSGAGAGVGTSGGALGVGAGAGVAAVRSGAPNPGDGLLAGAPTDAELSADCPLVDASGVGAEVSNGGDEGFADPESDGDVASAGAPPPGCPALAEVSGARVGPV